MSILFGVSPVAWVNDDMPELGDATPLSTILRDARDIGFDGVELGGKFPRDAATLKAILAPYGLSLVGGWYSGSMLNQTAEAEISALQSHLGLLQAMGSTVFVFAETSNAVHSNRGAPLTSTPRLKNEDWKQFGARMTDVADYIVEQGLRFAYHHHLGTVVESSTDLAAFLRATGPSVGLTLDTGHAALGGIEAVRVIKTHPERIAHVHCKDVRGNVLEAARRADSSFLDAVVAGVFTVPGDGIVDFAAVLGALPGYEGWLVVEAEQDPAKAHPLTYARLGFDNLTSLAKQARLL